MQVLDLCRDKLRELIRSYDLAADDVEVVTARPLAPEEAIGSPTRRDFPLLKGKEVMIQARFRDSSGQAYTDMPAPFQGRLADVIALPLRSNYERAVFVATCNAVMRHLGLVDHTIHCRDNEPEECARLLRERVKQLTAGRASCGAGAESRCTTAATQPDERADERDEEASGQRQALPRVAVIGLQPAIVSALAGAGCFQVRVTDMDPANIGTAREGVTVESADRNPEVIGWADLVLPTGTVLANGTADGLLAVLNGKPIIFYGVTAAGPARLMGYERFCPRSR
ncbi:MAG: Rossmann-like domain-containing protein [Betaproteobacteria bacterium]